MSQGSPASRLPPRPIRANCKSVIPPPSSALRLFNEADHLLSEVMPLCFKATRDLLKTCAAAATLGVALAPSNALAVTTWNWAFTTAEGPSGSGTFTTIDVVPTANTIYQITGVSGTYNDVSDYTVTGLDSGFSNQFLWDGTSSSPIIALSNSPIAINTSNPYASQLLLGNYSDINWSAIN